MSLSLVTPNTRNSKQLESFAKLVENPYTRGFLETFCVSWESTLQIMNEYEQIKKKTTLERCDTLNDLLSIIQDVRGDNICENILFSHTISDPSFQTFINENFGTDVATQHSMVFLLLTYFAFNELKREKRCSPTVSELTYTLVTILSSKSTGLLLTTIRDSFVQNTLQFDKTIFIT
jgi:hypothetical protein